MACPTRRSGKRSGFENVGESSRGPPRKQIGAHQPSRVLGKVGAVSKRRRRADRSGLSAAVVRGHGPLLRVRAPSGWLWAQPDHCADDARSEENTSELQSLMRISYAAFCLSK